MNYFRDFPGCPVVKNLPSNAGEAAWIPGGGTKISHAAGQLSLCATTPELLHLGQTAHMPPTTQPTCSGACMPQLQSPRALQPACCN